MTTKNIILHLGLGRCASSFIQYVLDASFGPDNRFIGDSKLCRSDLAAGNLEGWGQLFPAKSEIDINEKFDARSLAHQLTLKLQNVSSNDLYFSEERITDSLSYDVDVNISRLNSLLSEFSNQSGAQINLCSILVIRNEEVNRPGFCRHLRAIL